MSDVTEIAALARPLFPRTGLQDVGALVDNVVYYHSNAGHVKIWRATGTHNGWFAIADATRIASPWIILGFAADFRRTNTDARRLIAHDLRTLCGEP